MSDTTETVPEVDTNAIQVDAPAITFEDAAPVKRPFTGGRQAAPNPYTDVIAAIALKTNEAGDAVAKRFTLTHADENAADTEVYRAKRQLSDAGRANEPKVTVRVDTEAVVEEVQLKPGQPKTRVHRATKVTFWTVKPYAGKAKKDETSVEPTAE